MSRFSPRSTALKEAADWLARLRADDRSWEDERAFRAWMAADPRHAAAFEAANAAWEAAGALSRDLRDGRVDLEPSMNRRVLVASGVGALVALGGSFAFLQSAEAEVYQTDIGEQKHVSLDDGTAVFLDTNTKLVVKFNGKSRMVDLRYGRASFRVAPDSQKRAFAVRAAQKLVIGTRSTFDVGHDGDQVSVLLIQGRATIENSATDAGASQTLSDGERLIFASGQLVKLDRPDLVPLLAWHTGQAMFENSALSSVVTEMNRYSTIKLEIDDARLANMKVSGVYRVGDNAHFARSLERLLPIKVRMGGDRIELTGDEARILQG
ncbi:MAG TPA: FecR domain-containing protein [Rhizomicrobium sp.]|nr:FecR domain-containing protein [Rhizomicrobium sp.]